MIHLLLLVLALVWQPKLPQHIQLPNAGQQQFVEAPVRLKIPTINVDAAIQNVGLTANGTMEVPTNTTDVGWFDLGPRPSQVGSAVIAGHFNGPDGGTGVFANISKLKLGDKIYIEDTQGISQVFVVQGSVAYTPGYADQVFGSRDGKHLNLVTCDGVWDENKKTYTKRLVVFTDLETQN